MQQTFVYVIGPQTGPQKIGIAQDPRKRLKGLQTGNPFPLSIHFTFPTDLYAAMETERRAHGILAAHSTNGEWFDVGPAIAARVIKMAHRSVKSGERAPRVAPAVNEGADGLDLLIAEGRLTSDQIETAHTYRAVYRRSVDAHPSEGRALAGAAMGRVADLKWLEAAHDIVRMDASSLAYSHLRHIAGDGETLHARKAAVDAMVRRLTQALDVLREWSIRHPAPASLAAA